MNSDDQHLIEGIRSGDLKAFEELYRLYYVYLCLIAEHIVRNPHDSEEIVSELFYRLWKNRLKIDIEFSVKGYLIASVRNSSLNFLEQVRNVRRRTESLDDPDFRLFAWSDDYPLGSLFEEEVRRKLEQSIESLPASCRQIFLLSRNNDMKYDEIAFKLGISVNTVKTQIRIALSRLRDDLKEYLPFILIFILL